MNEQPPSSASERKTQEYIDRIGAGESKESITEGLPASWVSRIEAGMKEREDSLERKERQIADDARAQEIRRELGIASDEKVSEGNSAVASLIEKVSQGRSEAVKKLYKDLSDKIDDPESRKALIRGLFTDVYNRYRVAEYPQDPNEEKVWEDALKNNDKVGVDNRKSEWMYRGVFPKQGEATVTRGSFNVNVTPELIDRLDGMIADGKIRANYKFGEPRSQASPTDRHDSISIYFLEQPNDQALQELAQTVKPYVRGDNLLGKKIADGFFMSEVGSIDTPHIESFVDELRSKDPAFAESVERYTSPKPGRGDSLKMSEAQFYAVKDVARAFGYDISYNKEKGFEIR